EIYVGGSHVPWITQEGRDGDENPGYITHITDDTTIGFKYFDCKGVKEIEISTRGYASGYFEVKTAVNGPVFAVLKMEFSTIWETYRNTCPIPDGVNALYFTYKGDGVAEFKSFRLLH
ncbi:MAG: alpha-N-arabinofuranosidase, partial [Lachnospiraceae bacterium]